MLFQIDLSDKITTKQQGDKFDWSMTCGDKLHNVTLLDIFYFYSNYDQTSGIIWWKKKTCKAILQ